MKMKKHAYLIIAHNQFDLLKKLIELLDNERNDIYIHVDKKAKNFNAEQFLDLPKKSKIVFTNRIKVAWGGYSQIKCELLLLKSAIKEKYDYYHLLSGVDLPLKTQDEIHKFFDGKEGLEFIDFDNKNKSRLSIYHSFQEKRDRLIFKIIEKISLKSQNLFKINRIKNLNLKLQKGSNWFSITHNLANYIISKENEIEKIYPYTYCCLVINSSFAEKIASYSTRCIDWSREGPKPCVFKTNDYDHLMNSSALFARKFNLDVDSDIVDKIYDALYLK